MDESIVLWLMASPNDWRDVPDPTDLLSRPRWMAEAACRGEPTSDFFDGSYAEARAICERCVVREECLAFALADPDIDGLWAGTTPKERRRMRRRAA